MDRDEMIERAKRALLALWERKGVGSDSFDAIIARDEAVAVVDAITPDEYEQVGWVDGGAFWRPEGAPRLLGDVPVYVKRTPPATGNPEPTLTLSDAEVVEFHMTHPPVAPEPEGTYCCPRCDITRPKDSPECFNCGAAVPASPTKDTKENER